MKKRLFVDLEICYRCEQCTAKCSYFYHPANKGVVSILELANCIEVCRRCEQAPCVQSCPNEALEKQPDGSLKRYNMRCTSCKSCTLACPFGTLYPEIVPYLSSRCDYCLGRSEGKMPECVNTCPLKAVQFIEVEESKEKDIYLIGDNLAVHLVPWRKE